MYDFKTHRPTTAGVDDWFEMYPTYVGKKTVKQVFAEFMVQGRDVFFRKPISVFCVVARFSPDCRVWVGNEYIVIDFQKPTDRMPPSKTLEECLCVGKIVV